jgi:hypothetical protein
MAGKLDTHPFLLQASERISRLGKGSRNDQNQPSVRLGTTPRCCIPSGPYETKPLGLSLVESQNGFHSSGLSKSNGSFDEGEQNRRFRLHSCKSQYATSTTGKNGKESVSVTPFLHDQTTTCLFVTHPFSLKKPHILSY